MKRAVMMLLAIAMSGAWGMAQVVNPRTIQAIEVEAGLGTGVGLYKVGFDKVSLARSLKAEIRFFSSAISYLKIFWYFHQKCVPLRSL